MVHLSSSFEALPTQAEWEQLLAALHAPLRNGVPKEVPFGPFANVSDYGELFTAQKNHLVALRGSDFRSPDPGMPGGDQVIPRATYQDVFLLRDFWSRRLADAKQVGGHDLAKKLWQTESDELDKRWKDGASKRTDVYPDNNGFWRALQRVAVQITVAEEMPGTTDRVLDSVKDGALAVPRALYSGAKTVASGAAEVVAEIPSALGKMASGVFGGLFGAVPYLIVGGGLIGGYLLLRPRRSN